MGRAWRAESPINEEWTGSDEECSDPLLNEPRVSSIDVKFGTGFENGDMLPYGVRR